MPELISYILESFVNAAQTIIFPPVALYFVEILLETTLNRDWFDKEKRKPEQQDDDSL